MVDSVDWIKINTGGSSQRGRRRMWRFAERY
jgi:hypothetical protein